MGIIQQNNLKLLNVKISGDNEKIVKFPEDESLATEDWGALSFISEYKSIPLINKVLSDVNLAIAGNFNQIIDAEISNNSLNVNEHFFVKNIENVQGDERDIIIFSVGYAPTQSGRLNVQFGALNTYKGENRLNVAITRARNKVIVVASIYPDQLKVDSTKNDGPKLFKQYLKYALTVSDKKYIPQVVKNESKYGVYLSDRLEENNENIIKKKYTYSVLLCIQCCCYCFGKDLPPIQESYMCKLHGILQQNVYVDIGNTHNRFV